MKKLVISMFILLTLSTAYSQTKSAANFNPSVDSLAESLVILALNNAQIKQAENNALATGYEYGATKADWLNNITLAANLNEFSIKQSSATTDPLKQSTQYPRYNIGLRVPLGMFITNGKETKASYYRYQASVEQLNMEKQAIRRQVLILYEDYLANRQLLAFQQEVVADAKFLFSKHEEKFLKGEMTLEAYTASSKAFSNEQVKEVTLNRDLKVVEAQLEALIGMRMSDAVQQFYVRNK